MVLPDVKTSSKVCALKRRATGTEQKVRHEAHELRDVPYRIEGGLHVAAAKAGLAVNDLSAGTCMAQLEKVKVDPDLMPHASYKKELQVHQGSEWERGSHLRHLAARVLFLQESL